MFHSVVANEAAATLIGWGQDEYETTKRAVYWSGVVMRLVLPVMIVILGSSTAATLVRAVGGLAIF